MTALVALNKASVIGPQVLPQTVTIGQQQNIVREQNILRDDPLNTPPQYEFSYSVADGVTGKQN